jgi:inositol oxygenase
MQDRKDEFRDYDNTSKKVKKTYKKMQRKQTLDFVKHNKKEYAGDEGYTRKNGKKIRKRFEDAFAELDKIIDESDPDTSLPQIYHAYQTGEALRLYLRHDDPRKLREDISVRKLFTDKEWMNLPIKYQQKFSVNLHQLYPDIKDWSWLPLIGFLHDSGKVLAAKKWGKLPQWAVVGDTFPVGAPFSSSNNYAECKFFKKNPDLNLKDDKIKKFGKYKRNCGLDGVHMSWGHDEYFYSVLHRTVHHLPDEALYIVRYHSFYPWHTPRNGVRGYEELANELDWLRLPLLKAFQQSDLYSKHAAMPDVEQLKKYYFKLLEQFVPGREPVHHAAKPAKILW